MMSQHSFKGRKLIIKLLTLNKEQKKNNKHAFHFPISGYFIMSDIRANQGPTFVCYYIADMFTALYS